MQAMHNSLLDQSTPHPPRLAWGEFPDVLAAQLLIRDNFNQAKASELAVLLPGLQPFLVSAHAFEREGVNAIPEVFADVLGQMLGCPVDAGVVQTNVVGHTGADGFSRLAR